MNDAQFANAKLFINWRLKVAQRWTYPDAYAPTGRAYLNMRLDMKRRICRPFLAARQERMRRAIRVVPFTYPRTPQCAYLL